MVTHYYNLQNNLVLENASVFCTIHDYLAMKLAGNTIPIIDPTNAASFGLFDVIKGQFDTNALAIAQIDPEIIPQIMTDPCLGVGELGIPVYVGIGDNQASFLGSSNGRTDALLINMGTGGQISIYSPTYLQAKLVHFRMMDGCWLALLYAEAEATPYWRIFSTKPSEWLLVHKPVSMML